MTTSGRASTDEDRLYSPAAPTYPAGRFMPAKPLARAAGAVALIVAVTVHAQTPPPYRDARLAIDARVADLLGRMTLEEKVAQMYGIWNRKSEIEDAQGRFDAMKAASLLRNGIGEVSRPSEIRSGGARNRGPRAEPNRRDRASKRAAELFLLHGVNQLKQLAAVHHLNEGCPGVFVAYHVKRWRVLQGQLNPEVAVRIY